MSVWCGVYLKLGPKEEFFEEEKFNPNSEWEE